MSYKPNKKEQEYIAQIIAVGAEFKPLHQKLGELLTPEVRNKIAYIKDATFGVSKGSAGILVEVAKDKSLGWNDFCLEYFGVTARRINQLLDTEAADRAAAQRAETKNAPTWEPRFAKGDKVETQKYGRGEWIAGIVVQVPNSLRGMYWVNTEKNPDLTKPIKVGGLGELKGITQFYESEMRPYREPVILPPAPAAGCTDAEARAWIRDAMKQVDPKDESVGKILDVMDMADNFQELATKVNSTDPMERIEAIGDNPHYDRKDPYAYFEQFKSEPQTLGDELAAMLIEFGLDLYQIKDVLRYAEKDAKLTLGKTKAVAA